MAFPSETMRRWFENVERLRAELAKIGHAGEDGFCECPNEVGYALTKTRLSRDQQVELCAGLFWSVWIDQVLFTVCPRELYERFRQVYRFPKLHRHVGRGHASPACLIEPPGDTSNELWAFERPSRDLLLEDKRDFWGEVAAWLTEVGAEGVRQAAEEEFRKDLRERFPPGFEFLFPE